MLTYELSRGESQVRLVAQYCFHHTRLKHSRTNYVILDTKAVSDVLGAARYPCEHTKEVV